MKEFDVIVKHVAPVRYRMDATEDGRVEFNGMTFESIEGAHKEARRMILEYGHGVTFFNDFHHPSENPQVQVYDI